MTKTTNYEISKKLAEIGFKAKADNLITKISNRLLLAKIEKDIVGTSKEPKLFSEKSEKTDGEIININF
jgi:hypothetical protein